MGVQFDEYGRASIAVGDTLQPATINGKRLILPTQEILRNPDWKTTVAFHPLSENIMRGESEVLKTYRVYIKLHLTKVIGNLWAKLMEIAVNTDYHSKMSPDQLKILSHASTAIPKTLDKLENIIGKVDLRGDRQLINIYLKKGGKLDDKTYRRLAVVNFPIVNEFANTDTKEIFGIKGMAERDFTAIVNLFNYLLPFNDDVETYSVGSNDDYAPYFHSLTAAFVKIAKRLNEVIDFLKPHIDNADELYTDLSWIDFLNNFKMYRDEISPLEGNEGELPTSTAVVTNNLTSLGASVASNNVTVRPTAQQPPPVNAQHPNYPTLLPQPTYTGAPHNPMPANAVEQPQVSATGEKLSSWAATRGKLYAPREPEYPQYQQPHGYPPAHIPPPGYTVPYNPHAPQPHMGHMPGYNAPHYPPTIYPGAMPQYAPPHNVAVDPYGRQFPTLPSQQNVYGYAPNGQPLSRRQASNLQSRR